MGNLAQGTIQFGLPYDIDNQIGQLSYQSFNPVIRPTRSKRIYILDTAILYEQSEPCLSQIV